jgi:hypothetical protein
MADGFNDVVVDTSHIFFVVKLFVSSWAEYGWRASNFSLNWKTSNIQQRTLNAQRSAGSTTCFQFDVERWMFDVSPS